jgi:hypothetical protein
LIQINKLLFKILLIYYISILQVNDKKNGKGTYFYNVTGEKYQGEWKEGERNGFGTMYYAYGDEYTGMFKNGEK